MKVGGLKLAFYLEFENVSLSRMQNSVSLQEAFKHKGWHASLSFISGVLLL